MPFKRNPDGSFSGYRACFSSKMRSHISEDHFGPLMDALLDKVKKEAIDILDYSFTDDNKELFEFNNDDNNCLDCCFMYYAGEYDGRFDLLTKNEQVKYLVQSALADC